MNRIERAIGAIRARKTADLELLLGDMDLQQRKVLIARVREENLEAPGCVFYDYKRQGWVKDLKAIPAPQIR